jgi:hypothetical protein
MKRTTTMLLVAGFATLALLSGCSTAQQESATAAVAKLQTDVANGCLVVQPTLASIAVIDPAVGAIATANSVFCAANAAINASSITTIVNTSIPATETAVNASTLIPAAQKPVIIGALTAFQVALSTALVVYNQAQPAATATAASAPVAASQ